MLNRLSRLNRLLCLASLNLGKILGRKRGEKKYTRGDEKRKSDVETLKIWQFGERNGLLAYYR